MLVVVNSTAARIASYVEKIGEGDNAPVLTNAQMEAMYVEVLMGAAPLSAKVSPGMHWEVASCAVIPLIVSAGAEWKLIPAKGLRAVPSQVRDLGETVLEPARAHVVASHHT